ncbi:class I SAM-dependent methyltransferase [Patescibacteria group bacterium]|nr:MAG: class I SAM-dependent methyltransferase [Patescibacteria group bacterium]
MRNVDTWQPTKVMPDETGEWVLNPEFVGRLSHHVGEIETHAYIGILEEHARGDLLDLGAGTVPFYGVYGDLVDSVTTVDHQHQLTEATHIDVMADINRSLPFTGESFDTVLLADVLEHTSEPQTVLSESARVLRVDGTVIVFVPFMYWLHEEPHDHYRYTKHGLQHIFERSGLEVIQIQPYGGGPDVLVDTTQKMLALSSHERSHKLHHITTKRLAQTGLYKALRAHYQDRFPIGYTAIARKPREA